MTGRSIRGRTPAASELPPGVRWESAAEFTAYWGKTPDQVAEEFRREDTTDGEREFLASDEQFLDTLRRSMKQPVED